jgi:hypothetical protein
MAAVGTTVRGRVFLETAGSTMISSFVRWPGSRVGRSLIVAIAISLSPLVLAVLIRCAPLSEDLQESLGLTVLLPLRLVMRFFEWAVNCIGPSGRAEPASHYFPPWAVYLLAVPSLIFLAVILFGISFAVLSWVERSKYRRSQRS